MGKKRKGAAETLDLPVDLASRIGVAAAPERPRALPETARRVDGPIEATRGRPLLIGANEAIPAPLPVRAAVAARPAETVAADGRPTMIGLEEALLEAVTPLPADVLEPQTEERAMEYAPLAATVREAPLSGEMDLVVTPLATPDDWHHFELALRRLPGVGPLRIEYYRAGILKLRVRWSGNDRFAQALAKVPGYRIGILGEDRRTVQIRVARA